MPASVVPLPRKTRRNRRRVAESTHTRVLLAAAGCGFVSGAVVAALHYLFVERPEAEAERRAEDRRRQFMQLAPRPLSFPLPEPAGAHPAVDVPQSRRRADAAATQIENLVEKYAEKFAELQEVEDRALAEAKRARAELANEAAERLAFQRLVEQQLDEVRTFVERPSDPDGYRGRREAVLEVLRTRLRSDG